MEGTAQSELARKFGTQMSVAQAKIVTFGKGGHPKELLCIEAQGEGSPRGADGPIGQRERGGEASGVARRIFVLPRQSVGGAVSAVKIVPIPMVQQACRGRPAGHAPT